MAKVTKKVRGFEVVSAYEEKGVELPTRKTAKSAGYDFIALADTIIGAKETVFVPTGVKAYMLDDEYLALYVRSSVAIKRGLILINGVGIVDSDYYNNEDNEGEINIVFYNTKTTPIVISKGERIGQGIFTKFALADEDNATNLRVGGMGSTGE